MKYEICRCFHSIQHGIADDFRLLFHVPLSISEILTSCKHITPNEMLRIQILSCVISYGKRLILCSVWLDDRMHDRFKLIEYFPKLQLFNTLIT